MKSNKTIHYVTIGQLKAIKIVHMKKFTNTKPNIACPIQISPSPYQETK
jgi:hypothetical protein